ncbi:MAG: DUF2973 domain-containing protein [Gloeobacterales cyanobacterium]
MFAFLYLVAFAGLGVAAFFLMGKGFSVVSPKQKPQAKPQYMPHPEMEGETTAYYIKFTSREEQSRDLRDL